MKHWIYRQLKKPFFGRFMVPWRNPLSEAEKAQWQTLRIPSASGATLACLYAPTAAAAPRATIVLGHPMGKEAKGYFLKHGYAQMLLDAGYNVFLFDINGFGESTVGNFNYYEDILAAGVAARQVLPAPALGYHGISLGGQWATIAFAQADNPYQFAIVESGATTLDEFWHRFPAAYAALRLLNRLLPAYRKKVRMIDRIAEVRGMQSILFIYSRTDDWVPHEMGERFVARSGVPAELYSVPEGVHAQLMKSPHAEAYKERILGYFEAQAHQLAGLGRN